MKTIVDLMSEEGARIPGPRAEGFRRMLNVLGPEKVPHPVYALQPGVYVNYKNRTESESIPQLDQLREDLYGLFEVVKSDPTSAGVGIRSSFENPRGRYTPFVQGPNKFVRDPDEVYRKTLELLRSAYMLEIALEKPLNVSVLYHPFKDSSESVGGSVITHKDGKFLVAEANYGLAENSHDNPSDTTAYIVRLDPFFKPEICPVNFSRLEKRRMLGKGRMNVPSRLQQVMPLTYGDVYGIAQDALEVSSSYNSPCMIEFSFPKTEDASLPPEPFYIDCRKIYPGEWIASDLAYGSEEDFALRTYYDLLQNQFPNTITPYIKEELIKDAKKDFWQWWYRTVEERRYTNTIFSILNGQEEVPLGELSGAPISLREVFGEVPVVPLVIKNVNTGETFEGSTSCVRSPYTLWLSLQHAKHVEGKSF